MNEDNFIDEALKEHARHEGSHDQEFLDQLEARIDKEPEITETRKVVGKNPRSNTALWMRAAALVMVGVTAFSIYQINQDPVEERLVSSTTYSVGDEVSETPPSNQLLPSTPESSDHLHISGPSIRTGDEFLLTELENFESEGKVIAASATTPTAVRVPTNLLDRARNKAARPLTASPKDIGGGFGEDWEDGDGPMGGSSDSKHPEIPTGNKYGELTEQGFQSPLKAPLSTFSVDVDTASYTNIRKHIENGHRIDSNAVRIEEMINYFDYQYTGPTGDHPFAIHSEVAACPWSLDHRLVKIGLQGKVIKEARKAANLVFLIDVSGSMSSPDKLPLLVQSFKLLLTSLNENDRVSLVVYAGRKAVLLRPTPIDDQGREKVGSALKKLSAGGSTNGAAGISTAYDLAREGFIEGGVNRVVLATDGDFNVGTTNHAELLEMVKNQAEGQISLTILGFGQGNLNDNLMEQLTNHGDGNYFYLDSLREGQKVFQHDLTGTIQTIAKDVKIQVEFNPGKVSHYRLIGYANRRLQNEDFTNDKVDAGDIGAGHTVTALYEIIPVGSKTSNLPENLKYQKIEDLEPNRKIIDSPEMLTVKLRYKQPDGDTSTEFSETLTDAGKAWNESSENFRFASSVALWGMLLRGSEYYDQGNVELVNELALGAKVTDQNGERSEFLDLIRKWSTRR